MKTITRVNGQLMPEYCNFRLTRQNPDGSMSVEMDFHMSLKEAVEDAIFGNKGVINVHKVEWAGPHIGQNWLDATGYYLGLYHEGTHYE